MSTPKALRQLGYAEWADEFETLARERDEARAERDKARATEAETVDAAAAFNDWWRWLASDEAVRVVAEALCQARFGVPLVDRPRDEISLKYGARAALAAIRWHVGGA